ncbi:MAG: hypothetical protein LBH43_07575 [Treponema sp.]|jgi:hypothetical protein|nr:hypothetical protein [Treponema sp.]
MLKKAAYSICVIMFLFCFLGCPESEQWFDLAIMGITYSAYVNLSKYEGFEPNVVYTGNDAKVIFKEVSFHIDKNVGVILEEKKTYQEVVDILETFGLPIDLIKRPLSITAYYYISDAGHECAAFVEDTTSVHSRSVISTGL